MKQNCLLILLLIFFACSKPADESPVAPPVVPGPTVKADNHVVAHRGAWKEFDLPENSVASLQKAIDIKTFAAECDIQLTKDRKVIVFHDEKVGGKYFKDINYSELTAYPLSNGEKIPLLSDLLDVVVHNKTIQLWIDVKSLSDAAGGNDWSSLAAEEASEVIRAKSAAKQVAFIVGRKAVLDRAITAARGGWPCAYMNVDYSPANFVSEGYSWANFDYKKFYTSSTANNATLISEYTSKNIKLSVYTIDTDEIMDWFLAQKNVSAISTNYPFKLLTKIRK